MVDHKENYKFDLVVKGLTIFLLFIALKQVDSMLP